MSTFSVARKDEYKILLEAFSQEHTKHLVVEVHQEETGRDITLNGSVWSEDKGQASPQEMFFTDRLTPIRGWWRVMESLRRTESSAVPEQALEQVAPTRVVYDPPLPRWPLRVDAGQEVEATGEVLSYGEQGLLKREAYALVARVLAPQRVAGYQVHPVVIHQTVAGRRLEKISWLGEAGLEVAVYTHTDQPRVTSWQWILGGPRSLTLADLRELLRELS